MLNIEDMLDERYHKLFHVSKEGRYVQLFRQFSVDSAFQYIISANGVESVTLRLTKYNIRISHTWSIETLDFMDTDTVQFAIDEQVISMIEELCRGILNETKL